MHPAVVVFTLGGFAACVVAIVWTFTKVPTGFVPLEDRGLVMIDVWMPDSSSQERTLAAVEKVEKILAETDGVRNYTALPGFSMINDNGSNYALFFVGLEDWEERLPKGRDLRHHHGGPAPEDRRRSPTGCASSSRSRRSTASAAPPASICASRTAPASDARRWASSSRALVADGNAQSKLRRASTARYRAAVPQLFADVDREKVKKLGIPLQDVFSTMSGYLASAYVNDFNLFGRTWQVNVSADSRFRVVRGGHHAARGPQARRQHGPARIADDRARDRWVPTGSSATTSSRPPSCRGSPPPASRPARALRGRREHGRSEAPPAGTSYEWTALSYQEKLVGNQAIVVFAMALLVVYLILAALYESWFIPLSVVLSIPLAVLGAMAGLMYRGMDNNIYTQVGLVLLVGLGAKNAILIVEFAKAYREQGKGIVESAVEASRQRCAPSS